jgi:predicted TIM-barrel fold metal-dependent hydrolase
MNRRRFLQQSFGTAALFSTMQAAQSTGRTLAPTSGEAPRLVDTNVHLFSWPFRRLKYERTADLVTKLQRHRVGEAWAASFEALLAKDVNGANARLAEECGKHAGFLIPIGSVNPAWPDWEEDLRRCHEVHRMRGIRLYPRYQAFPLNAPAFARLLRLAAERGLLVQIALELEDPRVHHPVLQMPPIDFAALAAAVKSAPQARVQLLDCTMNLQLPVAQPLIDSPNVTFDISNFESVGILDRLLSEAGGARRAPIAVERLLFGSHAPYFPVEAALLRLFESQLTREQLEPIMSGNARRLLPSA